MNLGKMMMMAVLLIQAVAVMPNDGKEDLRKFLVRGDRAIQEKDFRFLLSLYPRRTEREGEISGASAEIVLLQPRLAALLLRGKKKYGKMFSENLGKMSMFVEVFAQPVRLTGWEDSGGLTEDENVASLEFEVKQVGNERIKRVIRFRKIKGQWFFNPYIAKEDGTDVLILLHNLKQLVGFCNVLLDQNLSIQSFRERIQPLLDRMEEI